MGNRKNLPESVDPAGNLIQQQSRAKRNDFDYSSLGIDGQERLVFTEDPFSQEPEYPFDEFH